MYKDPRECECGYVTQFRANMCKHKKYHCREYTRDSRIETELRERIRYLEQLVMNLSQGAGAHMTELHQEVKEVRKRKDRYAGIAAARCHLTEPQRRAIAIRQGWKCNMCRCDLAEYDVDHITPLWKGGPDEDANRQAVCVACHRQKTDRERVARATGEAPAEPPADPVVVG